MMLHWAVIHLEVWTLKLVQPATPALLIARAPRLWTKASPTSPANHNGTCSRSGLGRA